MEEEKRTLLPLSPAEEKLIWMARYHGVDDCLDVLEDAYSGGFALRLAGDFAPKAWNRLMEAQKDARDRFIASGGRA